MNLFAITAGAIDEVNPFRPGTVYVSTGYTNTRGILTPQFTPVSALLQVQALAHDPRYDARGLNYSSDKSTVYAEGNFDTVSRPSQKATTLIQFADDLTWQAVTQVKEWWPDWCSFEVTRQLDAADVQALLKAIQNGANPS